MQQKQGWPRVTARSQPGARRGGAAHAREGVKVADCIQSLRAGCRGRSE